MKKPAHEPYDRQPEHRPPEPESFASEAERTAFNKAMRRFTREGKLDPLIASLRRGDPLSVGVAEELANIFSGILYYTSADDFRYERGFCITVIEKKPAHRPAEPADERDEYINDAAYEVFKRVQKDGVKLSAAIAEVREEYVISKEALAREVAALEEVLGPLPRDRRGRKRRA